MGQFRHSVKVRYGDCDMQRIVFNANYLAYVDDAVDTWMRTAFADQLSATDDPSNLHNIGFDFMLKTVNITWASPLRFAETVDLDCSVARWGTTSFNIDVFGSVEGDERFTSTITYVSVDPRTQRPTPVPESVKSVLSH